MKKLLLISSLFSSIFFSSAFSEIKIGILFGFTGPIETLTPIMAESAELAFQEASDSELLLGGEKIVSIKADSTCTNPDAASEAAKKIISENVAAIVGAICLEETKMILSKSNFSDKIALISPAASFPSLKNLQRKSFFYRIGTSDTRGGQILADITKDKKIKKIAIIHANDDYGKNLIKVYKSAIEEKGIIITTILDHENEKKDYSSEVATLASAGGDAVAILGSYEKGGREIIQASLDSGAFDRFILSDRMINQSLLDTFGNKLKKSSGYISGSTGKGANYFHKVAKLGGIDSSAPYVGESYDAAALIVLAIQAGGSADRMTIAKNIMKVSNSPGIKIFPGELKKGLDLLAKGKEIDYEGATRVNFTNDGEAIGSFLELKFKGKKFITKQR